MTERKSRVPASPKVRKFARELGLDINQILGSKRQGRVIESDVKSFVKNRTRGRGKGSTARSAGKNKSVTFSRKGSSGKPTHRKSSIRKQKIR